MNKIPRWLIILVMLTGLISVIAGILRLLTPNTQSLPTSNFTSTNRDGTSSSFSNFIYTGPNITTQSEYDILALNSTSSQLNQVITSLVENLSLVADPSVPNLWQSEEALLTKDPYIEKFTLFLNTDPSFPNANLTPRQAAEQALSQTLPDVSLMAQVSEIKYFANTAEAYEESSSETAEIMVIPFTYVHNSLPVFFAKNQNYPFYVTVAKNNQVKSIVFYDSLVALRPISLASGISIAQALENINNNQASILTTYINDEQNDIDIQTLTNGQLTSVELEYRTDTELNIAYPFYRFSGTAEKPSGASYNISLITPAVATQEKP